MGSVLCEKSSSKWTENQGDEVNGVSRGAAPSSVPGLSPLLMGLPGKATRGQS